MTGKGWSEARATLCFVDEHCHMVVQKGITCTDDFTSSRVVGTSTMLHVDEKQMFTTSVTDYNVIM